MIEETYFEKKGVKGLDNNKVYRFVSTDASQQVLGTKYKRKQRIKIEEKEASTSCTCKVQTKPIDEIKQHLRSILLPKSLSEVTFTPLNPVTPSSSSSSPSSSSSSSSSSTKEAMVEMNNDNSSQETVAQEKGKEKEIEVEDKDKVEVENERAYNDINRFFEEHYYSTPSYEEDLIFDQVFSKEEEELVEDWEKRLGNKKNDNLFVRSKQKNKKEKVNFDRYVNARDKKRKEELTSYLSSHYNDVKSNRSIEVAKEISLLNSGRPRSTNQNSSRYNDNNNSSGRSKNSKNPLGLPDDVFQALEKLQWKTDITPEDYDLLLRLDDTVKPKTVSPHKLRSVPESKPTEEDLATGKLCTICLESYNCSHLKKTLPCGHDFHSKCIDYWLMNSSQNCPLDGLPAFV